LKKQQRWNNLDCFWLHCCCFIGESFDNYSDDVCRAFVNIRAKGSLLNMKTNAVPHIGKAY
jgi:translation initiation factor 4E